MSSERYVGERRALWHFLAELKPLVIAALGEDALLRHHIDRALKTDDLQMLRQARRIFHNHPEPLKRQLMRGIFEGVVAGEEVPTVLSDEPEEPPVEKVSLTCGAAQTISFGVFPASSDEDVALTIELGEKEGDTASIRVLIEPGTLPRSAAEALRQIADWIENDRRILSAQHWASQESRLGKADETIDQI